MNGLELGVTMLTHEENAEAIVCRLLFVAGAGQDIPRCESRRFRTVRRIREFGISFLGADSTRLEGRRDAHARCG